MKKILLLAVLGTLALPAVAQDAADEITVRGQAVDQPVPSRLVQNEARQYSGTYLMSNGQLLVISRAGQSLVAQLGSGAAHEVLAFASGDLVTPDRSMRIKPERDIGNYFTGDIVVELPSDAVAADGSREPLRLVSQR